MKTTQDKLDAFNSAIEEYEMACDAVASAICEIAEDLTDTNMEKRIQNAEPDLGVFDTLRALSDELERDHLEDEAE